MLFRSICEAWQVAGVTIQDPSSTWIDVTVQIGEDVTLLPGTYLKGFTTVGVGSTIGPEVTMTDTEVGAEASVVKSHVSGSKIGDGASVGPFAYLRPGTDLGAAVLREDLAQQPAVLGEGRCVPLGPERVQQPRRALDVREQERATGGCRRRAHRRRQYT
mgnify:CR=1 FL=1